MQVCIQGCFCKKKFSVLECLPIHLMEMLINSCKCNLFFFLRIYVDTSDVMNSLKTLIVNRSQAIPVVFVRFLHWHLASRQKLLSCLWRMYLCVYPETPLLDFSNLHAHAYLLQNSPSMKGLADALTTTQTHRAAYPLNITSIPLVYFIANHFKETISGFSIVLVGVFDLCVWACICFLAYYV